MRGGIQRQGHHDNDRPRKKWTEESGGGGEEEKRRRGGEPTAFVSADAASLPTIGAEVRFLLRPPFCVADAAGARRGETQAHRRRPRTAARVRDRDGEGVAARGEASGDRMGATERGGEGGGDGCGRSAGKAGQRERGWRRRRRPPPGKKT